MNLNSKEKFEEDLKILDEVLNQNVLSDLELSELLYEIINDNVEANQGKL